MGACRILYDKKFQMFHYPVPEEEAPDYKTVISNPMDVATVLQRVDVGHYLTRTAFMKDIELIAANAKVPFYPSWMSYFHIVCNLFVLDYTLYYFIMVARNLFSLMFDFASVLLVPIPIYFLGNFFLKFLYVMYRPTMEQSVLMHIELSVELASFVIWYLILLLFKPTHLTEHM